MRIRGIVLAALLPAACTSGRRESQAAAGYRGIDEVRILVKGME